VPLSVSVDARYSRSRKAIHVLTEKNPQPYVVSAYLGPRAGRGASRPARIADTGKVIAIAQPDGSFGRTPCRSW
jgi:hypothetical protein